MRFDLVVANGTVVGPGGTFEGDIGIRGGVIGAVGGTGTLRDTDELIDARRLLVLPGGVDAHVHSASGVTELRTLDSFYESTVAAVFGGTTTIVDFAIPAHADHESPLTCADARVELATGSAAIDVAFHGCITSSDRTHIDQIPQLAARGLTTLKMFTVYRGICMLELETIHVCLRELASIGGMALIHAESPHIIEPLIERFVSTGSKLPIFHAKSRPPESELDMVKTIIELVRLTGVTAYVVHVSTPEAATEITRARMEGVRIWAETCPHYVFLDDSCYERSTAELYVCSPPLRDHRRTRELWRLLCHGFVQVWGSDHCCHSSAQKQLYGNDFTRIPNGLPGIETRCPLLFSEGVMSGSISLDLFAALTAANPAKLNGLYPRKGVIQPGSDADLVLYDPEDVRTISASMLHMKSDFSPFDGFVVRGWPTHTTWSPLQLSDSSLRLVVAVATMTPAYGARYIRLSGWQRKTYLRHGV
jgi:dihydropyrimidinase